MTRYTIFTCIKKLKAVALMQLLFFISVAGFAQQKITGIVTGVDNSPLYNATVALKNTNKATTTDANGNFTISAKPGDILVISFVGYQSREIKLGNEINIKTFLSESTGSLDDVVVTGYKTEKKVDSKGYILPLKKQFFDFFDSNL